MTINAETKQLLELGFHLFPLSHGTKTPQINNWQEKATNNAQELESLIIKNTKNFGIYAGRYKEKEHLLILDIDVKEKTSGEDSLEDLENVHGKLPNTFTVRTQSGGRHLYFSTPEPIKSSAGKIGLHLDIRGVGGYTVSPHSSVNNNTYEIMDSSPIAKAPAWLIKLAGLQKKKTDDVTSLDAQYVDSIGATKRATHYLEHEASAAIEGSNGDATTYQVANDVMDFGISPANCLNLLHHHWNRKCVPPWDYDELGVKVDNACLYRDEPIGCRAPQYDFEIIKPQNQSKFSALKPFKVRPAHAIPKREWVIERKAVAGNLSLLIAPPGVGKSSLTLQMALSVATDINCCGFDSLQNQKVLIINNEDDAIEMERRIAAIALEFSIPKETIEKNLYVYSGVDTPFIIAKKRDQSMSSTLDHRELKAFIKEKGIKLVIIDPFVETHEGNENDNKDTNFVGRQYKNIAHECNCAVIAVHHTRKISGTDTKGHTGNIDSARGASSLSGVARIVSTLYEMSKADLKSYSISEDDKWQFIRLDDGKMNIALKSSQSQWYQRKSIKLGNGESVGVLKHRPDMKLASTKHAEAMRSAFASHKAFSPLRNKGKMTANVAGKVLLELGMHLGKETSSSKTITDRLCRLLEKSPIKIGTAVVSLKKVTPDKSINRRQPCLHIVYESTEGSLKNNVTNCKERRNLSPDQLF